MNACRPLSVVLVLACLLLVQGRPRADQPKDDKALLQGRWKVVSAEEEGKPREELAKARLIFQGDNLTVHVGDDKEEMTFKLDPAQKPKTIDIQVPNEKEAALGIYELNGDDLKLCVAEVEVRKRPTEFKAKDKQVLLLVLKRDKP
jgi:uncharacterized protein (TIGR03067 family)